MHSAAILRFEFIIGLVVGEFLLSGTDGLTNYVQSTNCDLVEGITESKVTINRIQEEGNDPLVWNSLFETAVSIASDFEIDPSIPRRERTTTASRKLCHQRTEGLLEGFVIQCICRPLGPTNGRTLAKK